MTDARDPALPDTPAVPLGELPTDILWRMLLEDGSIEYVSSEVWRGRGLTPDEAKAQMLEQILTPESVKLTIDQMEEWKRQIAAGEPTPMFHRVLDYFRADGTTYACEVRSVPRMRPDGVVEIIGITRQLDDEGPTSV